MNKEADCIDLRKPASFIPQNLVITLFCNQILPSARLHSKQVPKSLWLFLLLFLVPFAQSVLLQYWENSRIPEVGAGV